MFKPTPSCTHALVVSMGTTAAHLLVEKCLAPKGEKKRRWWRHSRLTSFDFDLRQQTSVEMPVVTSSALNPVVQQPVVQQPVVGIAEPGEESTECRFRLFRSRGSYTVYLPVTIFHYEVITVGDKEVGKRMPVDDYHFVGTGSRSALASPRLLELRRRFSMYLSASLLWQS